MDNVVIYPAISHSRQHSLDVIWGIYFSKDTPVPVAALRHVSAALAACSEGFPGDGADIKGRQKQFPLTAQKVLNLSSRLHRAGVMRTSPLLH